MWVMMLDEDFLKINMILHNHLESKWLML